MKLLLNLCLFLSILKGAELAEHPYVRMSELLKAAIANQEDMNEALGDMQIKRTNKIQSTAGITPEDKAKQLKDHDEFCAAVLRGSNSNLESFRKIRHLMRSVGSTKGCNEFLANLLDVRLHNLYSRKQGHKLGIFFPPTSPGYIFSSGCKLKNAYNRAIARGTTSFYKIITELCLETLRVMPKASLDPLSLALLKASPSLCHILQGGEITHSDDVIRFDRTKILDGPDGDAELYEHHFGKWEHGFVN